MSKKIVKKEKNEISTAVTQEWGQEVHVQASEVVIPKLLLCQQMSQRVIDGNAAYGEYVDSVDGKVHGTLESKFDVIPFHVTKFFIEYDVITAKNGSTKRDFSAIVPINDNPTSPGFNADLSLTDGDVERDKVMEFLVLLPAEVKELGNAALPKILSYRRTGSKTGNQLITQMYIRSKAAGKSPAAVVMSVGSESTSNDQGTYAKPTIMPNRESTPEEISAAFHWYKLFQSGAAKADHSDLTGEQVVSDVKEEY